LPDADPSALKRLLCATDFSEGAAGALEFATALARPLQAGIRIVHVRPGPVPSGSPMACLAHEAGLHEKSRAELMQDLDRCGQAARASGLEAHCVLLEGDPADEIVREGKRTAADIIVMGRHGHGAWNPWIPGSVSEHVLKNAPCPVVVVRPFPRHPGERPGHVLCGLDLGATSASVLQYALAVTKAFEADLHVLHVAAEEHTERARSALAATVARTSTAKGPRLHASVVSGVPWEQILGVAGQNDVDLIVVGSHGGGIAGRQFLGSTTRHLLRHADCPVLVVPARVSETAERLAASTAAPVSARRQGGGPCR
jgi:nucleotide-binding universal stress UspA family protein